MLKFNNLNVHSNFVLFFLKFIIVFYKYIIVFVKRLDFEYNYNLF